jgi:hypothetical protein
MPTSLSTKHSPKCLTVVFFSALLLGVYIGHVANNVLYMMVLLGIVTLTFYLTQIKLGLFLKKTL